MPAHNFYSGPRLYHRDTHQPGLKPPDLKLKSLFTNKSYHYPPRSLPLHMAQAFVEVALRESDTFRAKYYKLVDAWELPDCRKVLNEGKRQPEKIAEWWVYHFSKELSGFEPGRTRDNIIENIYQKYYERPDIRYLFVCCDNLILSLNRAGRAPQIIPAHSGYLIPAIGIRSMIDHLELDFAEIDRKRGIEYKPGQKGNRPRTRPQRAAIEALRKAGCILRTDETLLEGARLCYLARVTCPSLRKAADIEKMDPNDMNKRIEPYDRAIGWPGRKE